MPSRLLRRLFRVLLPLTVLAVLGAAATLWAEQQNARARLAEAELEPVRATAVALEQRAVRAEASLTAIGQAQQAAAAATATVVAQAAEPERGLERDLAALFAVFQDPTGAGYEQLGEYFSADALVTLRPEADYLRANGLHLGGQSTFSITPDPPVRQPDGRVQIHTHERWVYDERDRSDRQPRCFAEESEQTYTVRQNPETRAWLVEAVSLAGTSRSGC